MINNLRIQNFKSWQDTGNMKISKITGFFGPNSSGKTSILQLLLMLKQTAESSDRSQVLNFGDSNSLVNLPG
jgi:AAA15 family ATPase/GTPase